MVKILVSFLISSSLLAANMKGVLYEKGGGSPRTELYRCQRSEDSANGLRHARLAFFDLQGKEVAEEQSWVNADGKLTRGTVDQKQVNETGSVEVKGKKLVFTYTKNGETKTNDEDVPDNLVVPTTILGYLRAHWDTVTKGKTVDIRLAVLDRKETVGFSLFKVKDMDGESAGEGNVLVKMKPTSFIIAAIVDPLYFTFSADGAHVTRIVGRTLPKWRSGDSWKNLDADIRYTYLLN